jgi:hypothetical protein
LRDGDADSSYWAISGDPNDDYKQGFSHIIKDQKFYDENVHKWLPDPKTGKITKNGEIEYPVEIEKKLLGATTEKEGLRMVAVAPKCYYISNSRALLSVHSAQLQQKNHKNKETMKVKGVSLSRNSITTKDYEDAIIEGKIITADFI